MHDEVRVRQLAVDFLDHMHGEHGTVRLAAELVGAMRGAHGDRQCIDLGFAHELHGFVRIGQKLVVRQHAFRAVAVFGIAHAGFERTENAEFTFHRDAAQMRHLADLTRDRNVIVPVGRGLAVGFQRTVHHDGGEACLNGGHAGCGFIAMVEVDADRDMRIDFRHRVHHVAKHDVVGIGTRAARSLQDHRRIDGIRRFHDGQSLFHVVDVECRDAVTLFSGVIEQLPQRNARHF